MPRTASRTIRQVVRIVAAATIASGVLIAHGAPAMAATGDPAGTAAGEAPAADGENYDENYEKNYEKEYEADFAVLDDERFDALVDANFESADFSSLEGDGA